MKRTKMIAKARRNRIWARHQALIESTKEIKSAAASINSQERIAFFIIAALMFGFLFVVAMGQMGMRP
jgi:hypothetical protein